MRLIDIDAIPIREMNDPVWVCLTKQPHVDAVSVVRCKDCKRYGGITFGRTCRMFSGMQTRIEMPEHGFCSHGERRADGKDV